MVLSFSLNQLVKNSTQLQALKVQKIQKMGASNSEKNVLLS